MRMELAAAQEVAARASGTWDKFRKERDYHRMHHKRVAQVRGCAVRVGGWVELGVGGWAGCVK